MVFGDQLALIWLQVRQKYLVIADKDQDARNIACRLNFSS
jgi:hypothetical protein